jgi:signal transduction histidine kinase
MARRMNMPKILRKKKKPRAIDFEDENAVLREMAAELDIDVSDLKISSSHYMHFDTGNDYLMIESGSKEWHVAENEDSAIELAEAVVKQDLEESPENFNQNFIEGHIDLDRLRKDLFSDVQNMHYETIKEEADRHPLKFLENNNLDIPSPSDSILRKYAEDMSDEKESAQEILSRLTDMSSEEQWAEMGEDPEISDSIISELADQTAEDLLKNPLQYLEDIYGREDAFKKAIEIAGIDVDAATKEAVSTDGPGHFLSPYDGNLNSTPRGLAYWRHN